MICEFDPEQVHRLNQLLFVFECYMKTNNETGLLHLQCQFLHLKIVLVLQQFWFLIASLILQKVYIKRVPGANGVAGSGFHDAGMLNYSEILLKLLYNLINI